jgi:cysteine desulfurase/selenocysteine lyase
MAWYGVPATCRASFAFYNDFDDIDRLVAAIGKVRGMLG